ncbi:G/U mismatch-specific DNA glycosylase [Cellulomonas sp. HZM]|uniref:G/U mismatch-specific DNA glycosylase n=1 Tax=Cellulomonas sp. HZM TaxID=1454010 RepID=UPI00068E7D73|nr:G/U mismatch-specific DNA glycosylase [Cellulomonas sp. HZM]
MTSTAPRQGPPRDRPSRAQVAAAQGRTIDDWIRPGLRVLFCGYNPGLYSAAVGLPFARAGSRFWPALAASGLTDRVLEPWEKDAMLASGLGITSLVARATARADELTAAELVEGGRELEARAARWAPAWVAVLGVGAYRAAFGDRAAVVGPQPRLIGGARAWVLPNSSGLNAHYPLPRLAEEFTRLRVAVEQAEGGTDGRR